MGKQILMKILYFRQICSKRKKDPSETIAIPGDSLESNQRLLG
ncbi:hypothetical protein [Flavonifractor hominis]|uniref:Uncharacterized protein n=1 Tax=Flavonifractor hominis TaxID=3133178 RepID=A0ABV1ESC4_9FIRM